MNLFVTDVDPRVCAENLDDKRIGKLLMECNQMMSLAIKTYWGDDGYVFYETITELTSGKSHLNHPVSIWVRQSSGNFNWTLEHALALDEEWKHRFGFTHKSALRIPFMERYKTLIPTGLRKPFQNSARNSEFDFTHLPVPISYREYLKARWKTDKRPPLFTNRKLPEWLE